MRKNNHIIETGNFLNARAQSMLLLLKSSSTVIKNQNVVPLDTLYIDGNC